MKNRIHQLVALHGKTTIGEKNIGEGLCDRCGKNLVNCCIAKSLNTKPYDCHKITHQLWPIKIKHQTN